MNKLASSLNHKSKFLILGCGFSGSFFAKTIKKLGYDVLTNSRRENKIHKVSSSIVKTELFLKKNFDGVTHILSCIPPDKNGNDPVIGTLKVN